MLKANTGSSVLSDSRAAGREAASRAKAGLEKVTLAFVYASSDHDLPALVAGLKAELPGVPFIGGTSFQGVLLPEGLVSGKYFVGLMAIWDENLTVGVAAVKNSGYDDDAQAVGREAAFRAMEKAGRTGPPDYFHLTASASYEELYLKGLTEVIGRRDMFGCGPIDNLIMGDWHVLTNEGPLGDGLGVAFFYSDRPVTHLYSSHPYYELDERCAITKVEGYRKLVAVEGKSMLQRIAERTGFDPDFLTASDLQMATILDPIGIKDVLGDLTALRMPMYLQPDGSMDIGSSLAEGTLIIHMRAEIDDLVTSGALELERLVGMMKARPGAFHLAMGFGRHLIMRDEERLEEAAAKIIEAAAGTPFIMNFSLTECGFVADGRNTCGNLMLSYTGFPG